MSDTEELNKIIRANPFYVDPEQPGVIRGGWADKMGGFVVGVRAKTVVERLNASAAEDDRRE